MQGQEMRMALISQFFGILLKTIIPRIFTRITKEPRQPSCSQE
jgi:hypothetical protein